ncbi:hypothetical protein C8K66_101408 [Pseudomonas sp. GV105]|uniref:NACHT domain-containing protein n=1 Tax=Pseudomonas sp. GV105 TaxID=2135759 RepID=UPI000D37A678|nr:hypothetical protein [Pseudomonas sp. GV105]PUB37702.1 hypothetical protein C8K66_101408 [Pseudomonas sp. GV105]
MTEFVDEYIPLGRTFHELELEPGADDDAELTQSFRRDAALCWSDLLRERRVIILSEAGSGKTTEIRNIARTLRQEGKPAFFLRIEHIQHNFEDAFEVGTNEDFAAWAQSGEQGWLLLDSVDEARLRDPKDFELAIKKIGRLLSAVINQVHVVITGRTTAWRAKTDLILCGNYFPYADTVNIVIDQTQTQEGYVTAQVGQAKDNLTAPFRIFALEDLHGEQINSFLLAKKVQDPLAFLREADRKDALSLTTRPQDLTELVEYWNVHQGIGSRSELMRNSIERRLKEHDQDREDLRPITPKRLREGAQLIAAATTLGQQSSIRVPDGTNNAQGIAILDVLIDWNGVECATLLSRPLFDQVIYGAVRFHHRSVREYLTAEWLHELLKQDASRVQIERLFFRRQYDIEVIIPTMRPVLAWLALLDGRILSRLCSLAPEVLFEGGDPSQLPLETRRSILRQACEQLAQPAHGRTLTDFSAVKRFTAPDLTEDINALLVQHGEDENITWFLLLMVWHGQIAGAAAQAKNFALHSRTKYTRIAAFRALATVGSNKDKKEVLEAILLEGDELNRDWLAELILWLSPDDAAVEWLIEAVERAAAEQRYHVDSLSQAISTHISKWPLRLLTRLIASFGSLMSRPPAVDMVHYSLSLRYGWLVKPAAQIAVSIVEAQDMSAVDAPLLTMLCHIPTIDHYGEQDLRDVERVLRSKVAEWPEFNFLLFWHHVAKTREAWATLGETKQAIFLFSQMSFLDHLWTMNSDSFDVACKDITHRELLDDRKIALTLAFSLYRENDRPEAWLRQIEQESEHQGELRTLLSNIINPPPDEMRDFNRQQAHWRKQANQQVALRDKQRRKWKEHLDANVDALRNPGELGKMTNDQHYLSERLRESPHTSDLWSDGNWRLLIPEFGELIASAFRDGAVNFWRHYCPLLRSQGAPVNSTPYSVIFGLMGLSIEARTKPFSLESLSSEEAQKATRYALHELNGFPSWLPSLYQAHPQAVIDIVLDEIDYELVTQGVNGADHYVLYDVSWSGEWIWNQLAPLLCMRLKTTPKNTAQLRHMLNIIQGSTMENKTLASLAARKAKASKNLLTAPLWFAMWVGVDPSVAIATLGARLLEMKVDEDRITFAMHFITALIGSRRERRAARPAYRKVEHMKALYLLINRYIREQDDLHRANMGVYSPELRDDAQDARNALVSFIRETPGKEAFFALMEISQAHPATTARPWMAFQAKQKATLDSDLQPWSPKQVSDFNDRLERTPANSRDLWDLAIDRLLDLKHDLEDGDTSIAIFLQPKPQETEIRNFIGHWCRERSSGRYSVPQEEEFADGKRADLRFHGQGFDAQVPIELKIADKWTGPHLLERLEIQLCGDYMRDCRSTYGIFLLTYHGTEDKQNWELLNGKSAVGIEALVDELQAHWTTLSPQFPGVEDIRVIGIDLTKRSIDAKMAAAKLPEGSRRTRKGKKAV